VTKPKTPTTFALELGRRLRAVRHCQGMSLRQVEEKSRGDWKAVVVAAWERGDRKIYAEKLAALALFYEVPVARLLDFGVPVMGLIDLEVTGR
jgi:transcriptional regulator with XRE-family HTH domain